jgi:hypothetical protein
MQPPAVRPATSTQAGTLLIQDKEAENAGAAGNRAVQGRVVGKPQILAEPDDNGRARW